MKKACYIRCDCVVKYSLRPLVVNFLFFVCCSDWLLKNDHGDENCDISLINTGN